MQDGPADATRPACRLIKSHSCKKSWATNQMSRLAPRVELMLRRELGLRCQGIRFSGHGRPKAWIAADILRMENGLLAEHWDVLQDEATAAESRSGLPIFGTRFPS
jgi:hypothetical protein